MLACLLAIAGARASHADTPPAPEAAPDETPWGEGVSAERKDAAERLLAEGNALFVQNQFREALAKYEEAIAQWDHPAIQFNVTRALIALERWLDAQASLDKALAYGEAPLGEQYPEALNYKRLLDGQIGTLEVACAQPGVAISLDGVQALACPGRIAKRMLPGNHIVVGTKAGHQTETKDVVLVGGARLEVSLTLKTLAKATLYRSRWAAWKPWAVTGGGVVIAGVGFLVQRSAQGDLTELQRDIVSTCPVVGCTGAQLDELGHRAAASRLETKSKIGVGTMIGGGVVIVAGVVGVLLNRPRAVVEHDHPTARLVPSIGRDGGGLALEGRF